MKKITLQVLTIIITVVYFGTLWFMFDPQSALSGAVLALIFTVAFRPLAKSFYKSLLD